MRLSLYACIFQITKLYWVLPAKPLIHLSTQSSLPRWTLIFLLSFDHHHRSFHSAEPENNLTFLPPFCPPRRQKSLVFSLKFCRFNHRASLAPVAVTWLRHRRPRATSLRLYAYLQNTASLSFLSRPIATPVLPHPSLPKPTISYLSLTQP